MTTLAAQGTRITVQSATLVALSHLLTPTDFGLVAAVTAFTGIADILRDFGLSSAAMQARVLTGAQRSNLFWLNTASGVIAGALVFTCAGSVAAVYGSSRLVDITRALALVFVVDGIGTQFRADLNRRLRFVAVAVADVGSQTAAGAVAVAAAVAVGGTLPLVLLPIVQATVEMLLVVAALRWRPGLPRRGAGMRPLLAFGLSLFVVQLATYISRNTDNVTVGRRFGAAALGIYGRAFQLLELPLNQLSAPLTTVALPVLGRLQDEPARLLFFIRRGQNLLMQLTLLLLTVLASQAGTIVPIVLGHQWRASVPIFQILAIGGAFQTAGYATYWLFLATGKTAANLRYSLIARPLTIAAIIIGSFWGVNGVAWGFAIGLIVTWPFGLWWAGRATKLSTRALFVPCLRTIACYAATGIIAWRTAPAVVHDDLARLAVGTATLALGLGIAIALVPGFRRDVFDVREAVGLVRSGQGGRRHRGRHRLGAGS